MILAFDTSGPWCAAALVDGVHVVASAHEEMTRGQAERLMPMMDEMLGGDWTGFGAIAVGTGPGSFTGVRVGVAAARGLALGRGIPAIGIGVLEAALLDADLPAVTRLGRGRVAVQTPGGQAQALPEAEIDLGAHAGWIPGAQAPALSLPEALARIAATRLGTPQPRPAPIYLKAPDAAPGPPAPAIVP